MSAIEPKELIEGLQHEFDYPQQGAELVASKLMSLQPGLRDDFERWWQTGDLPEREVEGYTVESLMRDQSQNPVAAFLTLDWLMREPEQAREAIGRGYDRIVSSSG